MAETLEVLLEKNKHQKASHKVCTIGEQEVNNTCSTVETLEALLEKNKQQKASHEVHTIGEHDLHSSVDEYL